MDRGDSSGQPFETAGAEIGVEDEVQSVKQGVPCVELQAVGLSGVWARAKDAAKRLGQREFGKHELRAGRDWGRLRCVAGARTCCRGNRIEEGVAAQVGAGDDLCHFRGIEI